MLQRIREFIGQVSLKLGPDTDGVRAMHYLDRLEVTVKKLAKRSIATLGNNPFQCESLSKASPLIRELETRMIQLRPREEDVQRLKSPLGSLFKGSPMETMSRLRRLVKEKNPPRIIATGDVVSRETFVSGIKVHLRIIDNKTLRKSTASLDYPGRRYEVKNPAGVVTMEAWEAIRKAMRETSEVVLLVDGEEDLLALPSVMEAPVNSLVLYGQPSEGLVVVVATARVKANVAALLERMSQEEV